jgi:branched-chain amino acid transport system substrate-binding protein
MNEIKIGVLLPRSSLYPSIGSDLLKGLKTFLNFEFSGNYKIYLENIGFGAVESEVYSKAEKLLLQEDVEIIVAFLDHSAAMKLDGLFEGLKKILIVVDPGAQVPLDWKKSKYRYTISFQNALSSRLTGKLAADAGALKNIFATSFYEAGYLNCFSFQRGLQLTGGNVCNHFVIPFKLEQTNMSLLDQAVDAMKPDAVLAQYSAEAGKIFLDGFINCKIYTRTKLFVSPMLLEEGWLADQDFVFEGISGVVSWTKEIQSEENLKFVASLEDSANLFSLAGWDAAQLIYQIKNIGDTNDLSFTGPRGIMKYDAETNCFFGPHYCVNVTPDAQGKKSKLAISDKIEVSEVVRQQYINDQPSGFLSKWTNTYLCI